MLALDSSISCIEASEADVLDLYSSTPVMMALRTGSRQEQCEAYVCSIRKKRGVQVYLALVANNRKIFVYTSSGAPETETEYHHTLEEALEFARSLGFAPRPENLNYSPAMREVVVRNFKILRPPGSKVQALLRNGTADAAPPVPAPKQEAPKKGTPPAASAGTATPPDARAASQAAPGAARAVTPALAVSGVDNPAVSAVPDVAVPDVPGPVIPPPPVSGTTVAAALVSAAPLAQAAGSTLAAAAGSALAAPPSPAATAQANQPDEALTRALEESQAREQAARDQVAQLRDQLEQAQAERATHAARSEALQGELEQSRRDAAASLNELKDTLTQKETELADLAAQTAAQLDQETAAREALAAELVPVRQRLADLTGELEESRQELAVFQSQKDALAGQLATLSEELAAAREERAGLLAGQDALVEQLAAVRAEAPDLAALQAAFATLEAESAAAEQLREAAQRLEDELSAARAQHSEELARALARASALEEEAQDARQQASRLTTEMEQSEPLAQGVRQELEAACLDRDQARAAVAALEAERSGLAAQLASAQDELAAALAGQQTQRISETTPKQEAAQPEAPTESLVESAVDQPLVHEANEPEPSQALAPAANLATVGDSSSFAWTDDLASLDEAAPIHTPTARTTSVAADWYQQPEGNSGASLNLSGADDDFFPADDGAAGGPGCFTLRPDLVAISLSAPEHLVQLHTSNNVAYLSPDGKGPDSCQGYICCLEDATGFRIFIGLFAPKSSRTWVYAPEFQPEDLAARARATAAAIEFAEGVGLMMEEIQLGKGRKELVARCPVLACDQDR